MKGQVFFHIYETHNEPHSKRESASADWVGATLSTCPICGLIPAQKPDADGICNQCMEREARLTTAPVDLEETQ